MPLDLPILGEGIYRPREAARLIGSTPQEVLRWTRGSGTSAPIWTAHYQLLGDATEISFLDLVELRTVRALRQNGISVQAIRYAIKLARERFGIERPLSSAGFKTDGAEILMDAFEQDGELTSLSKKHPTQKVFRQIVAQSVSGLEYDGVRVARWHPVGTAHVVIDPARSFGAPILAKFGVSTDVLFQEWERYLDYKYVGRLYEIPDKFVKDAVQFEDRLNQVASANSGQSLI